MSILKRRDFILSTFGLAATSLLPNWDFINGLEDKSNKPPENQRILPKKLDKGDKVAVMGMAGALRELEYKSAFEQVLVDLGFSVVVGNTVSQIHGYFSGTDEERAKEFNDFVKAKDIKAIFFIKGGWGCARVIDKIDFQALRDNPKVIIGFSDITSLLNAIYQITGLVTFHGPVGVSSWEGFSLNSFNQIVCQAGKDFDFPSSYNTKSLKIIRPGIAKGVLIGGNLTVFSSLLGTPFFPSCKGKILFLEETKEEPYRIDRLLTSLRLAGVLNEISGLVFGKFNQCVAEKPSESFTLEEVIDQHFSQATYPVLWGVPFGHVKDKWTIPVGVEAELSTEAPFLKLIESGVS